MSARVCAGPLGERVAARSRLVGRQRSLGGQRRWGFPWRGRRCCRDSDEPFVSTGFPGVAKGRASVEGSSGDSGADDHGCARRSDSKSYAGHGASIAYDDPRAGHDLITAKVQPNITDPRRASTRPFRGHAVHCAGGERKRRQLRASELREQLRNGRVERRPDRRHVFGCRQVAHRHRIVPRVGAARHCSRAIQGAEHVEQFVRLQ